jgi:hypothetical protein
MITPTFVILSLLLSSPLSAHAQVPSYLSPVLLQPGLNTGLCLTAASNTNGAKVTTEPCTGDAAQQWTFTGGAVQIFPGKCLDVTGGNKADGTKLQIWDCTPNDPNQQFSYSQYADVLSWANNKCVDLTDGNATPGTPAQIWDCNGSPNQVYNTGYDFSALPHKSEEGQAGYNDCATNMDNSQNSMCQTAFINDVDDFCLWAPPTVGKIGDTESLEVAWCTKSGRGTRTIPDGTLKGVHFVKTPDYVQVTGVGNFTMINVAAGDSGGQLDSQGADARGLPVGGLVFGNTFGQAQQYHKWISIFSDSEFCFRACIGADAAKNCEHIYDLQGCQWNMPANYDAGFFESCDGNDDLPMGVYGTSTWYQGVNPTPPPHPAASSSNCRTFPTVSVTP